MLNVQVYSMQRKASQGFVVVLMLCYCMQAQGQINTEKLRRSDSLRGAFFSSGLSFGLVRGNSEFVSLSGDVRGDYVGARSRHFMVFSYAFKEAAAGKIANKGFLHGRTIWQTGAALAIEGFAQAEFDEFLSLKNRDLLGAGIRWRALSINSANNAERLRVHLGIGAMYEHEEYDTSPTDVRLDHLRSTNYLTLQWTPSDVATVTWVSYAQPLFENPEDLRLTAETSVEWRIASSLSFSVSMSWRYHSRPMTDVKRYDLEITNGIRFAVP
jgi:putative salt-induced outer membrane protein YdiY